MGSCVLAVGIIDCVSGVGKFGEIANGIVLVGVRIAGGLSAAVVNGSRSS